MRNVFLFLRRYSVFIIFLVMQVIALSMLFTDNRFHNSVLGMVTNEVAGNINKRVDRAEEFLSLSEQNKKLREQNAQLLSLLPNGSLMPDSALQLVTDTFRLDSIKQYRQYQYLSAKVISNSVFLQQNYIVLHRGSEQGIIPNMAVVSIDGIVGTVVHVSQNMSLVMSLLNRQSKVIATLKKGSGLGEVSWDGKDPSYLVLTKIPKTVVVKQGDTVVTSPYSDKFPPGLPIGIVHKVEQDQETNTYILLIKTAVDFYNVQHAYAVKNSLQDEMDELKKKMNKE
ncbi:MAG: rod shape-determining protein MreC [Chitinophagaceae bacterium]|nr:rod shape-determining protein MreC [Chitinophagaceae bacterium]